MIRHHVILLGPPGAGKGTQAKILAQHFQLFHLSTGDLLRAEVQAGTQLGKRVQAILEKGELVDDDTILAIIHQKLNDQKNSNGILYDGFPRTIPQAEGLDQLLQKLNEHVSVCIFLEVPFEEVKNRILQRAAKENRTDDTEEVIQVRLQEYMEKTHPLLSYYSNQNCLFKVSGIGTIEEVAQRLISILKTILKS